MLIRLERYYRGVEISPAAEDLVREARVARLATVDERGRPHLVPVCFVFADGVAYSVIDEKPKRVAPARLRRLRNVAANPYVQLLVDVYDEDWTRLVYVQLRGRASILEPGREQAAAVRSLRAKYPQYAAMALDEMPVLRIAVERAVVWGRRFSG